MTKNVSAFIPNEASLIEVNDSMIEAGTMVVASFDRRVAEDVDLAIWVYQAMEFARRLTCPKGSPAAEDGRSRRSFR